MLLSVRALLLHHRHLHFFTSLYFKVAPNCVLLLSQCLCLTFYYLPSTADHYLYLPSGCLFILPSVFFYYLFADSIFYLVFLFFITEDFFWFFHQGDTSKIGRVKRCRLLFTAFNFITTYTQTFFVALKSAKHHKSRHTLSFSVSTAACIPDRLHPKIPLKNLRLCQLSIVLHTFVHALLHHFDTRKVGPPCTIFALLAVLSSLSLFILTSSVIDECWAPFSLSVPSHSVSLFPVTSRVLGSSTFYNRQLHTVASAELNDHNESSDLRNRNCCSFTGDTVYCIAVYLIYRQQRQIDKLLASAVICSSARPSDLFLRKRVFINLSSTVCVWQRN